jgi:hypothetical protein
MMTSTFWYRMPASARITATGVFGLAAGIALSSLYYSVAGKISVFGIAMAGYVTVVMLISAIVGERLARRNFGSIEQYVVYAGALRSGELPTRVDLDTWRGWLARSRRLNRQAPVMVPLLGVFGVARALHHPSLDHAIVAGFLGLGAAVIVVNWYLLRGQISRLADAVERRAEELPAD